VVLSLKDIDYDKTIETLISQKKQAEQAKAVAITNAEKALQDAITAEAEGEARIAIAKANEEVLKITAVTKAKKDKQVAILAGEQELEVAKLGKQRAEEEATRITKLENHETWIVGVVASVKPVITTTTIINKKF
jgi:regulator of protease activity HflC (stomatin/prohibitin superfamily)